VRVLRDFELILQLEGSSWIWSEPDRGSVDIPTDALAFIPPGFAHAASEATGAALGVHFDLHAEPTIEVPDNVRVLERSVERSPLDYVPRFELTGSSEQSPLLIDLVTGPGAIADLRQRLMALVDVWSRRANRTLGGGLVASAVLGSVLRDLGAAAAASGPTRGQPDRRILELIRLLDEPDGIPMESHPTVGQLAELAHLGESAFRVAFVRTTGSSPRRYLEERRVEHAARKLVETDRPIGEIAASVGYDDPYHFSRVFRRVTGMAPRTYRSQRRRPTS
jgi:AraC-like DNA-binding protein